MKRREELLDARVESTLYELRKTRVKIDTLRSEVEKIKEQREHTQRVDTQ